jgi:hypothetical protein
MNNFLLLCSFFRQNMVTVKKSIAKFINVDEKKIASAKPKDRMTNAPYRDEGEAKIV